MKSQILLFVLGALVYTGCTITVPQSTIDTITTIVTNKPTVVVNSNNVPVVVTPGSDESKSLCGCDLTKPICDGPYDAAYMAANANSEECRIEPQTGLLIRYQVWIPSQQNYWMQSSAGIGFVRLEGSKSNGTLIAPCHDFKGFRWHTTGFGKTEGRRGNSDPGNVVTGNKSPYDHTRQYINGQWRSL